MNTLWVGGSVLVLIGGTGWAQVTQRVSLSSVGVPANFDSFLATMSPDGRYVMFTSSATSLVPGDTNGVYDVFVRDRRNGTTERVSVDSSGIQGNGQSEAPWCSANGRYVSFESYATNLVPGDTNGTLDVFVHDRVLGTTERVSISSGGAEGNSFSGGGEMTPDGRSVVFSSHASNLVPGVPPGTDQVYVRDRQNGTTELVSLSTGGTPASLNGCFGGWMSADGRYVVFVGDADNLVPGDTNHDIDVFVRDRQNGTTERVNVASDGAQANGTGGSDTNAVISADGRYVAFVTGATNLVPGDTNQSADIFLRDRQMGTTELVSVDSNGVQGDGDSGLPTISADGRYVVFASFATNLVLGDTNGKLDVFVRDRATNTTERISVASSGAQGNEQSSDSYLSASVDGRYVCFDSGATNLVPGDTNGVYDVFVRDRFGGTTFTNLCDPGVGGVIACPCSNAPGGPDRGCDNSSATGGAVLSASGGTFLSSDSLVFATSGEKPTALSILSQWTGTSATGAIFGMGVRCTSGTFKRLYTKAAVGGSITAPNFGAGEPQVSVRSAALGDAILTGQSRWYFVFYRDPIVLGGCPTTSLFNATQTGSVSWSP